MQIPYRTVEVSPLTKKQIKWADYKKVPVVMLDGEPYGDSTAIITRLAAELNAQQRATKAQKSKPARRLWLFTGNASVDDALVGLRNLRDMHERRDCMPRWSRSALARLTRPWSRFLPCGNTLNS
jgi:glutathione S-transferase